VFRTGFSSPYSVTANVSALGSKDQDLGSGIARASETPAASSRTRSFIARFFRPRRQVARPDFDHRTKTEHLATILLPDPVAARDTKRDVVDGDAEILKENKTEQNGPILAEMAATEFRVRCIQPLCHLSRRVRANSAGFHAARTGEGPPLQHGVVRDE
jgi:hypothetical protein